MRKFSECQKELHYFSPYVSISYFENAVIIRQRLFDISVCIQMPQISPFLIGEFFDSVSEGITERCLIDFLKELEITDEPNILIKRWMWMGILE